MRLGAILVLSVSALACDRPQKSCTTQNNGHQFCVEWRGYSSSELTTMICTNGKIENGACSHEGALGYCVVKDGKHENRDFEYGQAHDPSSCPPPYVWVPLH